MRNPIKWLFINIFCFYMFLKLWKQILYMDISEYYNKPKGTVYLSPWQAFKISWEVWFKCRSKFLTLIASTWT